MSNSARLSKPEVRAGGAPYEMEGNPGEENKALFDLTGTSVHYAKLLLYPTVELLAVGQGFVPVAIHWLPHPYKCIPVVWRFLAAAHKNFYCTESESWFDGV